MKNLVLVLILLFACQGIAFAGAPSPTTEKPIPVEQVTPPKPPVAEVSPFIISNHFTCGLGFGGSPLLGFVAKDQYGYPRTEFGIISGIGFGMTWFKGQPSAADVKAAVARVKAMNPSATEKEIPSLVRKELGVNTLNYVELGILNAEMGTEWILNDNTRTRFGFGLPTLISFGINWDF